ncbi:MAG: glycosyltransferase family 39 protein [Butyrivibrio sp.]|nr:glycosyltransferase family 39 protein [Butyrivibrio sp.]
MNESPSYKTEERIYELLPHEPEHMAATLFIIGMSIYYLWRMVAITPQYDELYTYYTFISRGPAYAAIHWPLPNNHVGYSVLSAFLDHTGNSYIGLRGVSLVCAISNIILIYRICKRYFSHFLSFGAMLLYSAMQIVVEYSVQGRGYTLATNCFLLAIYIAGYICNVDETEVIYYRFLALSFVLGLYTVPSSIYWVIPISFAIGLYLLINAARSKSVHEKFSDSVYFRKFVLFFYHGVMAAILTTMLYGIIWLAIGSNLLVKTAGSVYFGLSHGAVLVRDPIACVLTGMKYMLDQPYIQSLPADEFNAQCLDWAMSLFNYMLPGMSWCIVAALVLGFAVAMYESVAHFAYSRTVLNLIVICNLLITAMMLVMQHKLPYLRVFSYEAFIVTLCICICLQRMINMAIRSYNIRGARAKGNRDVKPEHKETENVIRGQKWYMSWGAYVPVTLILLLFILRASSYDFSMQLGTRENSLFNTLYIAHVESRSNMAALDCDQQYLLKFGWDIDCVKTDVSDADCVILDRNMLTPNYSGPEFWKFYQTYESIDWDYIDKMRCVYENEDFILYTK